MNAKLIQFVLSICLCALVTTLSLGQTCENIETFDDFGTLASAPPSNPGYFAAYGNPILWDQNCPTGTTGLGVRLKASVDGSDGDALGYTTTGGFTGGEPFFAGTTYKFSGSKVLVAGDLVNTYFDAQMHIRLTNDLSIGNTCPAGDCELVASKDISGLTQAACDDWGDMLFTPMADYDHFIISVTAQSANGEDELFIMVDNWCVEEVLSICEASFTWEEENCGEICFSSTSTGADTYLYEFAGPAPIPNQTTADFCIDFPMDGQYQVQLSISCADGSFDTTPVEIVNVTSNGSPPTYDDCPTGPIFLTATGANCEIDYTLPDLGLTDPDFDIVSESCTLDGVPFAGNTVTLTPGPHVIRCTAVDACDNEVQCDFEITLECETSTDSTDCTNFDDQSAGGWYRHNKILNSAGTAYVVSNRPVGLPATGPSGLPTDVYMKADDLPGSTWLVNDIDYNGDWKEYIGQCFCFDYNVIDDGDSGGTPLTAAPYFLLTSAFDRTQPIDFGVNPVSAIRWRSTISKTERDGWNNFCIEVDTCDALGNLPSVKDGVWQYIAGASATCQDFNDILCNVEAVMFGLDLTGSPTEEYGFDNICTGPCPPEPADCEYAITADTISQENGSCCYELDFTASASWYYIDLDLTTPGVIFNTAMVDTNDYNMDTLSNGTKLRITGKTPSFGGNMPISTQDFLEFCFANVDSAAQTPQCVIASYYGPGPVDGAVLACRDTLKFNCPAPTTEPDSCLVLSLNADCDPDDPHRYKLTFDVTNNTAHTARRINLTSQDPNVKFLPIGAPAGAIPQSTISVPIPGGLAAGGTATGLMATLVMTSAITAPTQWCVEGHILTDGMCCTAPDYFCTELDVCCDPCDEKDIAITDISGVPAGQTLSFGASDDGIWTFTQVGGGADVTGPTLEASVYDNTAVSDGEHSVMFINFDFVDQLCEGATVVSAKLKLYADTNTGGHFASAVDNTNMGIHRLTDPWDESTLSTSIPNFSPLNITYIDSPTFPYENYDVDVTALVNDIINLGGYGFNIQGRFDKAIELYFASKDHPNPALHPQLVLTIDDSECPEPSLTGDCCYAVDLINECPTDFFTSVELKSITPGVNIGSHATGGNAPQDWYISNSTPNCVTWNHTSGYIPSGTTTDLVQFCLDDIDPTEVPQEVVLHWYALDGNGEPYIACSDTMTFECEPPVDNPCIAVLDTELKGSPCDSIDCYETPWCVQWLRDTIAAQATLPEILSYNTVEKALWNGQVVFIATNPTPPGAANIGNTDIYLCNGNLIQSCAITIGGEVCMPNANIDPFVDVTSKVLVWQTGGAIPPLDPDCASGTGGQNVIDVCLTFKNTSQHYADQFILYPITSGVSYWPNPVSLLPGGSNPCDTSTVSFQLYGSAVTPGTTVKFAVRLADQSQPDDWCCFESDTVCVTIPECPPADECCASQDTFDMLVAQGFQVTQQGCTYTVCANQFDTCHWFNNASPLWGDGTPVLTVITQSDPPNNCWTHTYSTPGTYTITMAVSEGDDIENYCWSDTLTLPVTCPDEALPCDSLLVTNAPATMTDSTCCSIFTIENNDPVNTYKGLVIRTGPPVSISQIQGLAGYTINQLSPYRVEVLHPSGNIPTGIADVFTLCTTDYSSGPQSVTVHWLQQVGNDCIEVCPTDLEMQCSDDDEFKCFEFVQDSVDCESSTYCFQIKNTSNPSFDIASVILYGINGGTLTPTSISIPGGPLAAGATSDWMCISYSGAAPGDSICYSIAAENAMTGNEPNICCTDTLVQCFTVPDCPVVDDCCDISQDDFDAQFANGINYNLTGCELCLPFALDSCEYLDVDYGDGTTISLQGGGVVPCYTYPGPSGSYSVTVDYYRLDANGDTCLQADAVLDIATSCPPTGGPCLTVIDGELDCELEAYCFRITNTSTFTMKSLAFIELTAGVALSPDPYQLLTPLAPGATSEEICLNYIGGFQGDTICFDVVGHQEDITIGEPPAFCCQDTIPVCFVVDCPVDPATCIAVVQDSIDCESNNYCIKVRNDTYFDMNSIAFQNYSAGHSLSPDPLGIPTLTPGSTSDWICLTFAGAVQGDEVCYNIIGHEQDLSIGQEPIFCCSDTTQYCFTVDCEVDPCCSISSDELDFIFTSGFELDIIQCELVLPFGEDTCGVLTIDFGDGNMIQQNGSGLVTHTYTGDGLYDVSMLLQYFDADGNVCQERDTTLSIELDNCGSGRPCSLDELQVYNALSPNNDGLNDVLIIEGGFDCRKDIIVYNRWGQRVYSQKDYNNDWRGNHFSGDQLAEGTYFLVIEIRDEDDNVLETEQTYVDIRK